MASTKMDGEVLDSLVFPDTHGARKVWCGLFEITQFFVHRRKLLANRRRIVPPSVVGSAERPKFFCEELVKGF